MPLTQASGYNFLVYPVDMPGLYLSLLRSVAKELMLSANKIKLEGTQFQLGQA